MNRTTGVLMTLCVFGFSMALGWLTGSPAAARDSGRHSHIPAAPPEKGKPDFSTPAKTLARLERNLAGPDEKVSCSAEELDWILQSELDAANMKHWATRWITQNPASVLAWIERHGGSGKGESSSKGYDTFMHNVQRLFGVWAAIDMEAAVAASTRPTWGPARAQALFNVLPALWTTDPQRARVLFEQNLDLMADKTSLGASLGTDGKGGDFLEFLKSLPPGKGRSHLLASALMGVNWSPDAAAGAAFWNAAPPELKQELVIAGYTPLSITSNDGMDELQRVRAESTRDPAEYRSFLSVYGGTWAARDLPAALAWTKNHLQGSREAESCERLFRAAAAGGSFGAAVSHWQALPSGNVKARLAGAILAGAPENRRQDVEALIGTLPPGYQEIARDAAVKRHGRFPQIDMR